MFMCWCVGMFAHLCMCDCGHVYAMAYVWRSWNNLKCWSSPSSLRQALFFVAVYSRSAGLWAPWGVSSPHRCAAITDVLPHPALCGLWRFILRSPCLHSKCSTHWAIFPTSQTHSLVFCSVHSAWPQDSSVDYHCMLNNIPLYVYATWCLVNIHPSTGMLIVYIIGLLWIMLNWIWVKTIDFMGHVRRV